ncbi:MAG: histidine kinase [Prevotella sp.]|nr:histidine kinase [Prevotella sp.]
MSTRLRELKENLIYIGLFALLFLSPVLSLYIRTRNDSQATFLWSAIFDVWKVFLAYLVVFIFHNFVLAPILIYRQKKSVYFISTAILFVVFIFAQHAMKPRFHGPRHRTHHEMAEKNMEEHGPVPPEFKELGVKQGHPGPHKPNLEPRHKQHPPVIFGQADIIGAIVLLLMFGMNLGVKLYFKTERDRKEMQQLEKESLAHQLEYLKYQINPHFFMNTLNNIHALVDIDPDKAKTSIVVLSKMMRYILYEGNHAMIPLQREIDFINHYIELMKMRYTSKVSINIDEPEHVNEGEIPPLLLITFVENAFKHGISYQHESFIDIKISVNSRQMHFSCKNSKAENKNQEKGGVGLTNVRKRLSLIYKENYQLDIRDADNTYEVSLELPLTDKATSVPASNDAVFSAKDETTTR